MTGDDPLLDVSDEAKLAVSRPLKRGDHGREVRGLYEYLLRFGYFSTPNFEKLPGWLPASPRAPVDPDVFDDVLEDAVRLFQQAHGLPVDGTLNEETLRLTRTPRCGFPDLYGKALQHPGQTISDFARQGSSWLNENITYRFSNYTGDLPVDRSQAAIAGAFARWAAVTKTRFFEVSSGGDILIGWYNGNHGDGSPFDGASGVLAHAFYPNFGGDMHFDDAEPWTDSGVSGFDLPSVALHELGHSLGLAHSADASAVMYAYYSGVRRYLTADDIQGIQSIYGARREASWSSAGPAGGKYCTQIKEIADPYTWNDNYMCTDTPSDMRWSSAGPIAGMRCTQILEIADPHTWSDNYLCVPLSSPYQFSWSSAGPLLGRPCVQWHEFADPHTWNDNFLCYTERLRFSSAGPVAGAACVQIYEPADPHTWSDNYLCSTVNEGFRWSSAGPVTGMRCTQILESADPHTWNDNYLCVPPSSSLFLQWSSAGPIAGKTCVRWYEAADPYTWDDNYLCY
jgi:peptidoglycan hydrolase-like protein with peptidoglycan-binding domain